MKRTDFLPLVLLVPVLGFVAREAVEARIITVKSSAAVLQPETLAPSRAVQPTVSAEASNASPVADLNDVRERLRRGEPGTYIGEILTQRDSALARWPERTAQPLRVWIASGERISGWDPSFANQVREAFDTWTRVGIPMRFTFVVDSTDADVHVSWIDYFKESISGKTLWARDKRWWIVDANITLALHHRGGDSLDGTAVKAIALHEVGHLLGLDHTADTTNIMTARVRVRDLSEADRSTVRLLYSLPAGSLK